MIIIKGIKIEETFVLSEEKPDTVFGSNFDGVNFIFFESEEERDKYYKSIK